MKQGIGIFEGYVIAKTYVIQPAVMDWTPQEIVSDRIEKEQQRLQQAVDRVEYSLQQMHNLAAEVQARIFHTHIQLLRDPEWIGEVKLRIKNKQVSAITALFDVTEELVQYFNEMELRLLKERLSDLYDVRNQIYEALMGKEKEQIRLDEPVIIVAEDLTPSMTAGFDLNYVAGMITTGGQTTHTAIIARSLAIPAITGLDIALIPHGKLVILDSYQGLLINDPTAIEIQYYQDKLQQEAVNKKKLEVFIAQKTATADGHNVTLALNIASSDDTRMVQTVGADGIGLFRSEFLFMNRTHAPSEEEQYETFKKVIMQAKAPVIIRTLDVGGDKIIPYLHQRQEQNPFLGLRAIRLCLQPSFLSLFKEQLRAICRASAYGKVKILFPMITTLGEIKEAKALLQEVQAEIAQQSIPFDAQMEIGMMIEVPSIGWIMEECCNEVDFFSIGTNDLVQYMMAADRTNEKVQYLQNCFHPSVLRMIQSVINTAHAHGKKVGVCGEMAGEKAAALLLVGMGIDELSMSATQLLSIRKIVAEYSLKDLEVLSKRVVQLSTAEEISEQLKLFISDV
ncbi:phosphoenolpyruvate--protein phosphotransferase [Paenibacillus sp. FSL H8-0548]|uniref:phosphoenolpyruvate--protein phosphotransferase n=1 Tax=Paenibacillus sp. FSL H8-0548 TaxID=1920422 RepID=UPI00096DC080|nr:phosphoenolpyruvate--protein phosphotransferase [Paenibacillus sp. FSL H8-0548]OMF26735.1 phosphoenolpyruvate--protein phosphotransferase [Paenibacillus sp. FSL H8-0548]